MWPPFFKVLLHEPALLVGHAAGYASLIQEESSGWGHQFSRRLRLYALLAVCAFLSVLFAGMALMLYAVTSTHHWLLWLVPAVPLLGVIIAGIALSARTAAPALFPRARAQFDKDLQLFGLKSTELKDPE